MRKVSSLFMGRSGSRAGLSSSSISNGIVVSQQMASMFTFTRGNSSAVATPNNSSLCRIGRSVLTSTSGSFLQQQVRANSCPGQRTGGIHVESNATPNPECLRFFSMDLSFLPPGTAMDLPNDGHAYKSPLAEHLFKLDGIKQLYFADEYITITKELTANWGDLTSLISEVIVAFSESGDNILAPEMTSEFLSSDDDTEPADGDDECVLALKELLHTRIRPMLKADGGNVKYVGIEEGSVYVMLEGACKTCPSSNTTLKVGIERMLMHWIPEVSEVLEVDPDFAYDFKQRHERKLKEKQEAKEQDAGGDEASTTEKESNGKVEAEDTDAKKGDTSKEAVA